MCLLGFVFKTETAQESRPELTPSLDLWERVGSSSRLEGSNVEWRMRDEKGYKVEEGASIEEDLVVKFATWPRSSKTQTASWR